MKQNAIKMDKLNKEFGSLRALDNVSLEIPRGTIFGYLGSNGAGKTTTIHLLLGLIDPSQGRAQVLGFDTQTHAERIRKRVGALLEHNGLYEQLSANDNLDFYGRVWRMSAQDRQTRIKELLLGIGLWDRRHEKAGKWSRGMKQKLALARAIFHRPKLIFLDEPTAGLDVESAASVRRDLETWVKEDGVTIFLTSHNMSEVEKLCDRVAFLMKGQILAVGKVDEMLQQHPAANANLENVYLSVMEKNHAL
jgi:ABC-2 type transport system ATP-binding protein